MPSRKTREATRISLGANGPARSGCNLQAHMSWCILQARIWQCTLSSDCICFRMPALHQLAAHLFTSQTFLPPAALHFCHLATPPFLLHLTFPGDEQGVRVKSNGRGIALAYFLCMPRRPPLLFPLPLKNTPLIPYVCLRNVQRNLRKALQDAYFYIS